MGAARWSGDQTGALGIGRCFIFEIAREYLRRRKKNHKKHPGKMKEIKAKDAG